MRILIDRTRLVSALSDIAPLCSPKSPVAVMKYAKITTKGNRIKFEGGSNECSVCRYADVIECDENGSFLVNPSEIAKLAAKIKDPMLTFIYEGNTVTLKHTKGEAEFQTEDAAEYPKFRMPDAEVTEMTIPSAVLLDAVSSARDFVSKETIRPIMCAIYAYAKDGRFGYCASDTHVLIHDETPIDSDADTDFLIMPVVFGTIMKACKGAEGVTIRATPTHVSYRIGDTLIQTVQAKGTFPNFRKVIPTDQTIDLCVSKEEFADVIGRLSLMEDKFQSAVRVQIGSMDMILSIHNLDMGKRSKETILHDGCDREMTIGLSTESMTKCLAVISNRETHMHISDPSKPFTFTSDDKPDRVILAMPMCIVE